MPYLPHTWVSGEKITVTRLNTMENGIAAAGEAATTAALGIVKIATAPADAANPIAVGTNDPRMAPSGTSGAGVISGNTKIESGSFTPAGSSGTYAFPVAFATAPVVVMVIEYNGTAGFGYVTAPPTTTGFSFNCLTHAGSAITPQKIHWIAVGT